MLATILDPRYKHRCFSSSSKATAAREMLTEECLNHCGEHEIVTSTKRPRITETLQSSLLGTVVDMMSDNSGDGEHDSLQEDTFKITAYLQEPNLPLYNTIPSIIDPEKVTMERNDPLEYWKNNEKSKQVLAQLARKCLSAPAGSVPSERLFSTAAIIADDRRNRLLAEKVEMLLF